LVGRHATQSFIEVGPLELKGLPEPVGAVEVIWEPVTIAGSVPLPGRLVGAAANALFGFFGRVSEMEAIVDACKRSRVSGRCEAVFVAGEAGIGKTALVAQAARQVHADGAVVLFGHADEDLGVAYQPWIEALGVLVRESDADLAGSLRVAQRAALARLIPEVDCNGDGDGRVADPDTERLLLLEAVVELLAAASREQRVMLVLDDVHWIDTASVQLLRHVIASATAMDVTIACTYRDTDLGRGDALTKMLADLHREANVTRVALAGLDDQDVVELIAAAAGHALDDDAVGLAHALRRETEGNPFFTGEMLRHLGESGGIIQGEDGRWRLAGQLDELGLPSSVRDVVGRRVERLGEEALRVLSIASVIGREFDLELLAGLVNVDVDPLLDLMDDAVGAAVLVESDAADQYRFAHALIQHTLYDELSPTRRQRTHQRIAEALEMQTAAPDASALAELATHWIAATRPADVDKAVDYARRAGDAALAALSPDDAIRWYRQALDVADRQIPADDRARAQLLAALGAAQHKAGDPAHRETLLNAATLARQAGDTETLVEAALGFSQFGIGLVGDDASREVIEAALDQIGTEPAPARARLLAALLDTYDAADDWQRRRDLALQAVDSARRAADDESFVDVIDKTAFNLATPERRDDLVNDVEEAVAIADRTGDPVLRVRIRVHLAWARYQLCDLAGADAVLAEMRSLSETVGLPRVRYHVEQLLAGRLLLAGQADDAEVLNEQALALGMAIGAPEAMGSYGAVLSRVRQVQGRLDELVDFYIDLARDLPSMAALRSGVIFTLSEIGRLDEARDRLDAEVTSGFDIPYDTTFVTTMCNLMDGAAATGHVPAARALIDRMAPYVDHVNVPWAASIEGSVARPLARVAAVVGDYQQADAWFAIAHDIHARLQAPFWTARGQLEHADMCVARGAGGDVERARDLATTAAATANEYTCTGLTKHGAALLAIL
jgi:hypothetical protein